MSPKHTITQEPTGDLIPGASKAWMSHFPTSSNGRIIRVRLPETNYLAYSPELLCRLTEWHNLHGGACPHGRSDPRYAKWPCSSCRTSYLTRSERRVLNKALDNPNRKIAMVPGRYNYGGWNVWVSAVASKSGYPRSKMGKKSREGEKEKHEDSAEEEGEGSKKKNRSAMPSKMRRGKDLGRLRFAHHSLPGQDDPVESGRDMAASGDVFLPSDGRWQFPTGSGAGVTLGTSEEKELADLRKQGLLNDAGGDEGSVLTLDSVARADEPVYTVRLVQKRKEGGKGKGKGSEGHVSSSSDQSEKEATVSAAAAAAAATSVGGYEDETAGETTGQSLDVLSQEVIDAMPDHCWADFLADMEAEGWVPVVDDDLVSVAESWVVMESDSEDSDEKT